MADIENWEDEGGSVTIAPDKNNVIVSISETIRWPIHLQGTRAEQIAQYDALPEKDKGYVGVTLTIDDIIDLYRLLVREGFGGTELRG